MRLSRVCLILLGLSSSAFADSSPPLSLPERIAQLQASIERYLPTLEPARAEKLARFTESLRDQLPRASGPKSSSAAQSALEALESCQRNPRGTSLQDFEACAREAREAIGGKLRYVVWAAGSGADSPKPVVFGGGDRFELAEHCRQVTLRSQVFPMDTFTFSVNFEEPRTIRQAKPHWSDAQATCETLMALAQKRMEQDGALAKPKPAEALVAAVRKFREAAEAAPAIEASRASGLVESVGDLELALVDRVALESVVRRTPMPVRIVSTRFDQGPQS
jgi:hypothetical protein